MISITIGHTSCFIITKIQTFKENFVTFSAKILFWDQRKITVSYFNVIFSNTDKISKLIRDPEFRRVERNSQDYHTLDDVRRKIAHSRIDTPYSSNSSRKKCRDHNLNCYWQSGKLIQIFFKNFIFGMDEFSRNRSNL